MTVVDRAGRQRGQDLDHDAAELRIERMELAAAVRPMTDALGDAVRWLETKKDFRGEVYVFTDMAAEAWPEETLTKFAKSLDELPGANVYLIDVGAAEPKDLGLGRLKLSSERVAPGGLLQLNTELNVTGAKEKSNETTVSCLLACNGKPGSGGGRLLRAPGSGRSSFVVGIEVGDASEWCGLSDGWARVG